jgi:hypothetical protein
MPHRQWTVLAPNIMRDRVAKRTWLDCAAQLAACCTGGGAAELRRIRAQFVEHAHAAPPKVAAELALAVSILYDLATQGWNIRVADAQVEVTPPAFETTSADEQKKLIRSAHLIERDTQLCQPATRLFVREMERRRLHKGEWHSIFSLMRDGRELERKLRKAASLPVGSERAAALRNCVDPYLEVVHSGMACEFTGIRLTDIWRYFRHTWNTVYQSTPGRKIWFLVRDRAAPNHPVVGIAAFGSAIVQLAPRDEWIGWSPDVFIDRLRQGPSRGWAKWLQRSLTELIRGIYVGDFRRERLLSLGAISSPASRGIARLRQFAQRERRAHRLYPSRATHKAAAAGGSANRWKAEALTPLFRAKRAEHLADLLEARRLLRQAGFRATTAGLHKALESASGRKAVRRVLRYVKAAHVGVDMMDITVCGAVAPYGPILGGKLVGLLLQSPQAISAYAKRYRGAPSVIASSMAGRPVRRSPNLVLLSTTSLYGVASSQYNRLRLPAEAVGGRRDEALGYVPLGRTVGFGSFHFSRETMALLDMVLARHQRGRPVNSIFGEGVNPKLRKVRSALDLLGLPSDLLLQHRNPRLIYGVPVAVNFREVLLGLTRRPRPLIPSSRDVVGSMAEYWRSRWLSRRIENEAILDAVKAHVLAYPIQHGARVVPPPIPDEEGRLSLVPGHRPSLKGGGRRADHVFAQDDVGESLPSPQPARTRLAVLDVPDGSR